MSLAASAPKTEALLLEPGSCRVLASHRPSRPPHQGFRDAPSPRYTLRLTARRGMRPGDWRGASGTVHQNSFDMVPLPGSSMCGRDSLLIHGGDCSADPSRVRSACNNAAFAATIFHFFVVCASSYRLFRAALSSRMKCAPVSKMAPSWKLCSNKPAIALCCCYFSFAALFPCAHHLCCVSCFVLCMPHFVGLEHKKIATDFLCCRNKQQRMKILKNTKPRQRVVDES
jgi:hypothetical protein